MDPRETKYAGRQLVSGKGAVHSADYQLLQSEFDRWDKRFGPHEIDAFVDDVGSNAFCKRFGRRKMMR